MQKDQNEGQTNLLLGKNAVFEAINAGREIDRILFAGGSMKSVGGIVSLARKKGIPAIECDRKKLDKLGNHQGVVAYCAEASYAELADILARARAKNEPALVVLCDRITDPHNLGAIIRSAEVAGAHGVIIPKKKSAGLNAACARAAAGALEHLPVARCASTMAAVLELKQHGLRIIGADVGGRPMYGVDLTAPLALIIGSEGLGISPEVKKLCDDVAAIPQRGVIPSLNASNACAVLLFETLRQRGTV